MPKPATPAFTVSTRLPPASGASSARSRAAIVASSATCAPSTTESPSTSARNMSAGFGIGDLGPAQAARVELDEAGELVGPDPAAHARSVEEAVDRVVLLEARHRQVERHVRAGQAERHLDHQQAQRSPTSTSRSRAANRRMTRV